MMQKLEDRQQSSAPSQERETSRVEAFSDGVFSIAMTLLVLDLKVPSPGAMPTAAALWSELSRLWPSYLGLPHQLLHGADHVDQPPRHLPPDPRHRRGA